MKYSRDEREPVLTIKKFERAESPIRGILKVDKKAGDSITLADIQPYAYPSRYKVVEEVVNNWFPLVEATVSVSRPLGYIIPAEHPEIVDTLLCHDIQICMFAEDVHLDVEAYLIQEVIPAKYDYLPPENIDVAKKEIQTVITKGDFYVSCAQPAAQLIPSLLEPQSQYGLIRYWKFHLVPDSGEIFPFFRFVKAGDLPLIPYKAWKK
jgi:hypothetical protein